MSLKQRFDFNKAHRKVYVSDSVDGVFNVLETLFSPLKLIGFVLLYIPQLVAIGLFYQFLGSHLIHVYGGSITLILLLLLVVAFSLSQNSNSDVPILKAVSRVFKGIAFWYLHPYQSLLIAIDFVIAVIVFIPKAVVILIEEILFKIKKVTSKG